MSGTGFASTVRKVIFSRFFLVAVTLWVIFSFAATFVSVGEISDSSVVNSYSIPDSQIAALIHLNGSTINFYGQDFNQYGLGIAGTSAYYNLTGGLQVPGSVMRPIGGGYLGKTDHDGFISFNITHVNPDYDYFMNMHFHNSVSGYNSSPSYYISTGFQGSPDGSVSMTAVRGPPGSGDFSIHVFTTPGKTFSNATVYYQRESYFFVAPLEPAPFNYGNTVPIGIVNVAGSMNIQTHIPLTGAPYFYGVGLNGSSGGILGAYYFSTLPTPMNEAEETAGSFWGISGVIGMMCAFSSVIFLAFQPEPGKAKRSRFIPPFFRDDRKESNQTVFLKRIGVSLIASIPIVAVTVFFTELAASTGYGVILPATDLLLFAAGMLLTLVMASSYASILAGAGLISTMPMYASGYKRNLLKTLGLIAPMEAAVFLILFRDYSASVIYPVNPASVVVVNFLDPFGYMYLILQKVNSSLLFGQPYMFNSSAYGITYPSLFLTGIAWIILWIAVPFYLFRRFSRRGQRIGENE